MQMAIPIIGFGLGMWAASSQAKNQQKQFEQMIGQMQSTAATNLETMPETPVTPELDTEGANVEAESAAQQQIAAAAAAQQKYNPTSGLGITTSASGQKKQLLGA